MWYEPQSHEAMAWRRLMEARSSWFAIVARHRDETSGMEEAVFDRKGYWRHLLGVLCLEMMFGPVYPSDAFRFFLRPAGRRIHGKTEQGQTNSVFS